MFKEFKFYERLCSVYSKLTFPVKQHVQQAAEKLDQLRVKFMRGAEAKCRTCKMGEVEHSPLLDLWGKHIYIWRTVLRWQDRRKRLKVNTWNFRRKAARAGIRKPFSYSSAQIRRKLVACKQEYQHAKEEALKLWLIHLRDQLRTTQGRGFG